MTEHWKSNERKYCDFCKCWIAANKASVNLHESGYRHKENVSKRLGEIRRDAAKSERDKQKVDHQIRKMEEAAMNAYARDISSQSDMTAKNYHKVMVATTSKGSGEGGASQRAISRPGQIDPLRLAGNSDDEDNIIYPTVGKLAPEEVPNASLWVEGQSPEGHTYYWNVKTNKSVWEPPEEGFLSLDEYNRINQIAVAQQEMQMQKEAKKFQANANEEVARYNRERLKNFRPKTEDVVKAKKKREEQETFITEAEAATPDIGVWQTVVKKEEKHIDWQLPASDYFIPQPPVSTNVIPERPVKTFKEKQMSALDPEISESIPATFKKRKVVHGKTRQRFEDD